MGYTHINRFGPPLLVRQKAAPVLQVNLFITFNYAKLEKNPDSRRLKGITFRTDVHNDLSFVTG